VKTEGAKGPGGGSSNLRRALRQAPRPGRRRSPQRADRRDRARARKAAEGLSGRGAAGRRSPPRLLVALDSEGTVLDSTRPRQELCFAPAFAARFGRSAPAAAMAEVWRFVSLESRLRDANRYKILAAALRIASRRPELAAMLRGGEGLVAALEAWLSSSSSCSSEALEAALRSRRADRALERVLDWSRAVDESLAALPPPRPFEGARALLPELAARAELLVLSSSTAEEAKGEWEDAGIAIHAARFMGRELGGKAACLAAARAELGCPRLLVVGDSLVDLEAARSSGAAFFPVEPGEEEASWSELASSYLPRFVAGEAPRGPLAAFLAALSSSPPWR